ncbi:MAG: acyltransferase family protein, partial [Chloroflexi bacterium]|nr:acyltransferase family protein [Chloroflexota bacterium]
MPASTASTSRDAFRPDIEGLRGLAVLVVILFHAGLAGILGGFVGVDVFFVISGFLITGLLLRERERTGGIALLPFYARRARRLLPAAIVVLVVTLVAAMNLVAPLDRPTVGLDGAAAALSIGNIRFAMAAGDYFSTVAAPSPFLHFWSLAVEEQFYLVWPALILLVARGRHPSRRVLIALGVIVATSFAANLVLTDVAANWAFYSLPTRAWELGIGGLVAAAAGHGLGRRVPRGVASLGGWLGLAAVLVAILTFDSSLAWPGVAAIIPSVGTAIILAAGCRRLGPSRILAMTPLRFLGRISYSLYLVHWPILALAPFALGAAPDELTRVGLVGLSIGAAIVCWAAIETPFRGNVPRRALQPGRTVSVGFAAILAVVVVAAGPSFGASGFPTVAAGEPPATAEPSDEPWLDELQSISPIAGQSAAPSAPGDEPFPLPGPSADPATDPTPAPSGTPRPTSRSTLALPTGNTGALPANVQPALGDARADEERLRRDGCLAFEGVTMPPDCIYGVK